MIQRLGQTDQGIFSAYIDQQNAPHEFLCPISRQIMKDPVIIADGHSFEKAVIEKWFKEKNKSPCTGLPVESKKIIENRALKQCILYHNERQKKANENAQKLIENANDNIKGVLPELINQIGLIDIDKIVTIIIQNSELRKTLKLVEEEFKKYSRKIVTLIEDSEKTCLSCIKNENLFKNMSKILKGAQNILQSKPIVSSINTEAKQFQYIPISCTDLKRIDFKQILKPNWQAKIFKSYGIEKSSMESLLKRIRIVNNIGENYYTQVWRTKMPVSDLYDHIQKSLKYHKCTYRKIVKEVGTRVSNLNIQFNKLELEPGEYLIIENGKEDELVFRGQENKCQYCYYMKPEKVKCECQTVCYCSMICATKDVQYHKKQCPFGVKLIQL